MLMRRLRLRTNLLEDSRLTVLVEVLLEEEVVVGQVLEPVVQALGPEQVSEPVEGLVEEVGEDWADQEGGVHHRDWNHSFKK